MSRIFLFLILLSAYLFNAGEIDVDTLKLGTVTIPSSGVWIFKDSCKAYHPVSIVIEADDVILDLQGYTFDGDHAATAILIHGKRCVIQHGILKNFADTAIIIDGSEETVIRDITITDSKAAISLFHSTRTLIENVTIERICKDAISILDSPMTYLKTLMISYCGGIGININENSAELAVEGAFVKNGIGDGFYAESDGLSIFYLVCEACNDGVVLKGSHNRLRDVQAIKNKGSGFIITKSDNSLYNCMAFLNEENGLLLMPSSKENSIMGGNYSGNKKVGILNKGGSSNVGHALCVQSNQMSDVVRMAPMHIQ